MIVETQSGRNFARIHLKEAILVCHGFPYDAGSVVEKGYDSLAEKFADVAPTVIFDFSGCGFSEGFFSIENWTSDLERLARSFEKVSIVGYSMGAFVAPFVATKLDNLKKLVLVAPPTADIFTEDKLKIMYEHASSIVKLKSFEDFLKNFERVKEISPEKWIGDVKAEKLLIHGTKDSVVPFECGIRIYEAAKEPKAFATIEEDHFLRRNEKVLEFIKNWLAGKIVGKEFRI